MVKVILTIGVPGAGKTTWAEGQRNSDKGCVVISRDDIRNALFGENHNHNDFRQEKTVTDVQKGMIKSSLANKNVTRIIIADTNLNNKHRNALVKNIQSIADEVGREVSINFKVFDTDWNTVISRNFRRGEKAVPIDVLRRMYVDYLAYREKHHVYSPKKSLPKAVIFDIDGTLADNSHRSPYTLDTCDKDTVIQFTLNMLNAYKNSGYKIIVVSGRHSGTKADVNCYRDKTIQWLSDNNIHYDEFFMRPAGCFDKDDDLKQNIFFDYIAPKYNVELAVDDRDRVVEMWRRIGVKCAQINFGAF